MRTYSTTLGRPVVHLIYTWCGIPHCKVCTFPPSHACPVRSATAPNYSGRITATETAMSGAPDGAAAGEPPAAAAEAAAGDTTASDSGVGSNGGASSAAIEEDRLYYEGLPLGLLHPIVLDHGTAGSSPLTAGRRRFLCYFMHRHLEFRLPEVESLAAVAEGRGTSTSGSSTSSSGGPAVLWEKPFGNRVRLPCPCPSLPLPAPVPAPVPAPAPAWVCIGLCVGLAP